MNFKSLIDISKLKILFTDIYFLLTLLVSVILLVYKFQYLSLPYFSDELWVYGPAVRKMGLSFPSMLPSSLAIEDHWAHPMFFFFTGGLWCLIFGTSIFSTHVFAAILSIFLLITIYLIGKNFFNKEVGFYTALIFSSQSIFHGQFTLVLPEVLLTLLIFLSIYFYVKENTLMYLIFGSCMVLTKETGIFPIVAIVLWTFIRDILYKKNNLLSKTNLKKYFIFIIPLLIFGLHLIALKITYGWFVLPVRVEMFEFSWDIYRERIMHSMHYVFIGQGRRPIVIAFFVTAILINKKFPIWGRILLLALAFSMMKVFFKYWKLPDFVAMIIIPVLLVGLMKFIFWDVYKTIKKQGSIIAVFSILIILYLLFSSAQFDSLRYVLCIIPIFIMMGVYFVQQIPFAKKFILPLFTVISIGFSFFYISSDTNFGDDTNNYDKMCSIRKESIQYLEKNNYYDHQIKAPFLFKHAIERPLT